MRTIVTSHRKCGRRKEGGVYAVTGEATQDGWLSRFTEVHPPIPYPVRLHRGPRLVNAEVVLDRQPMQDWWMEGSARTEVKKAGDAYYREIFGMTLNKRLTTGECRGCKDASESLAVLAAKITLNVYDTRLGNVFRQMTLAKIDETPAAPHYTRLHTLLTQYTDDNRVEHLMGIQAAVWRMAYALPPRKWNEYIHYLVSILALMNLRQDARAMRDTFVVKEEMNYGS